MTPKEAKQKYDEWKERRNRMLDEVSSCVEAKYNPIMQKFWKIYSESL